MTLRRPNDGLMLRAAVALFRGLLWLYPASFRAEYGREMTLYFRDQCRRAVRQNGLDGLIRNLLSALVDLLFTAIQERYREMTTRDKIHNNRYAQYWRLGALAAVGSGICWLIAAVTFFPGYSISESQTVALSFGVVAHLLLVGAAFTLVSIGRYRGLSVLAESAILLFGITATIGILIMNVTEFGWIIWFSSLALGQLGLLGLGGSPLFREIAGRWHWLGYAAGIAVLGLIAISLFGIGASTSSSDATLSGIVFRTVLAVLGITWTGIGALLMRYLAGDVVLNRL